MNIPVVDIVADLYATPVQACILNFNGGDGCRDFYDEVTESILVPYAGALYPECHTDWKKFGRASFRNTGTIKSWFYYGTPAPVGDFTVHFFHKTAAVLNADSYDTASHTVIWKNFSVYPDSSVQILFGMAEVSPDVFQWYLQLRDRAGTDYSVSYYGTVLPATEYHVAIVGIGRKLILYVNGVAQGYIQATTNRPFFGLGFVDLYAGNAPAQYTYIDAFEFTREAKWKADFTVPASAPRYEFAPQAITLPYLVVGGELIAGKDMSASFFIPIEIGGTLLANGIYGTYEKTLPAIQLSASGGNFLEQSLLPVTLYGTGKIDEVGHASCSIPKLSLTATGFTNPNGTLYKTLPAVLIAGQGNVENGLSLVDSLPLIRLTASGIAGRVAALTGSLPSLRMDADAYWLSGGISSVELPSISLRSSIAGVIGGLSLNLKNNGLARYTGYPFGSLCNFGNVYLGCGRNGIYLLSHADDAGTAIEWKVNLGELDLGNNALRYLWLTGGIEKTVKATVTMKDKDKSTYEYYRDPVSEGDQEVRIKVGKGIRGHQSRYVTIEVSGEEGSAAVDGIHVFGVQGKVR